MEYSALFKENQIVVGSDISRTIIVCGWTPQERIIKSLEGKPYAAIGQLYSALRGINFLIRNLLYNPQIIRVIMISATRADVNSKSIKILNDFFHLGVISDGDKWKINSKWGAGYIDGEIPLETIDSLRLKLVGIYRESIETAIADIKYYYHHDSQKPITDANFKRVVFPYHEPTTNIIPSNIIGQRIEGETIAECWVRILARIRNHGIIRPTGYDGSWQELINLVAVVNDEPENFYIPDYLPVDKEFIDNYIPQMLDDSPYVEGVINPLSL